MWRTPSSRAISSIPLSATRVTSIGCGLGSAGFMVFDDTADMVAVAAGVARFLSVESCGQCSPCKKDGIELAARLATEATVQDMDAIERRVGTVSYGALLSRHATRDRPDEHPRAFLAQVRRSPRRYGPRC